jgi:ABC-2 type transport system ATP-binding protein
MRQPVIRAEGLTKRFGQRLAVENLSLEVESGEAVALLGPNGAGKTTTVRMLACLLRPTGGTAQVLGCDIGNPKHHSFIRSRVGLLTESPGIYDRATTAYNLLYFARLYGLEKPEQAVERYLRQLGLWGHRNAPAASLSKGLKQRLAVARALLHEPDLIFLDEPTSGLDPATARKVRDFLLELKKEGRSLLLTTHNLAEAERLADRIVVMKTGLVAIDTPEALRERLFGHRVCIVADTIPKVVVDTIRGLPFVRELTLNDGSLHLQVDDPVIHNPEIVARLTREGVGVRWVTDDGASLEEIYLELVDESEQKLEEA